MREWVRKMRTIANSLQASSATDVKVFDERPSFSASDETARFLTEKLIHPVDPTVRVISDDVTIPGVDGGDDVAKEETREEDTH